MKKTFLNHEGTKARRLFYTQKNLWLRDLVVAPPIFTVILLVLIVFLLASCQPTVTPAPVPTETPTPTATASVTSTPTLTATPTLTPEPVWYQPLDESYFALEYRYGLVEDPQARVYASLQDAVSKTGNFGYLPSVPAYVAVMGEETRDGQTFYTRYYGWMAAEDVQLLKPSTFRGILLTRDADFRFGWVLADIQSVNAAGTPIQTYTRYQVVHEVPALTENPGYVAIGPDEWLPDDAVALTSPQVPDDAGADTCRFIHVDLAEQTLRVYDQCKLVFATLASTGKQAGWTYPGRFSVQTWVPHMLLTAPSWSTSVYYQEGVPNFMTYDSDLGFHGAYWHDDFGTPVSHGCVNLSPADAQWLYDWAWLWQGATVIISKGE